MKKHDPNRYLTHVIKTDKQTTYYYKLKVNDRLNKAFDIIPPNAIINKGRCGIGGTYLEIKAKRNSIIVVPTNAIIDSKCFDKDGKVLPNYFVVRGKKGKIDIPALCEFIQSPTVGKKIFCTPEGLAKVMNCGVDRQLIYDNWFLLLDECHTFITDSFRERILIPFNYVFKFINKALISATPYYFSDPRFEKFDMYNIGFRGKVAKINIQHTSDVPSVLYSMLTSPEQFSGNVHIFINSIKYIGNAIRQAQITDVSIFCKRDKKNMDTLDELRSYYKHHPTKENFSKFNFYTSRYFEGWDLKDLNATLIIVSDYRGKTMKSGVSNKCIQAAGRNRLHSEKITHLTNSRGINELTPIEVIQDELLIQAIDAIQKYNEHLRFTQNEDVKTNKLFRKAVLTYGYENESNKIVSLSYSKLDQLANEDFTDQEFNHIGHIVTSWRSAHFSVNNKLTIAPAIPDYNIRLKKLNKVMVTINYLEELEKNNLSDFPYYKRLIKLLPKETDYIIESYYEIGKERMEALGYNFKLIREEVIKSANVAKKEMAKKDYWREVGNEFRTTAEITKILVRLYTKYEVYNPKKSRNEPMSVFATTLDELFTDVTPTRNKAKVHGRYVNIY